MSDSRRRGSRSRGARPDYASYQRLLITRAGAINGFREIVHPEHFPMLCALAARTIPGGWLKAVPRVSGYNTRVRQRLTHVLNEMNVQKGKSHGGVRDLIDKLVDAETSVSLVAQGILRIRIGSEAAYDPSVSMQDLLRASVDSRRTVLLGFPRQTEAEVVTAGQEDTVLRLLEGLLRGDEFRLSGVEEPLRVGSRHGRRTAHSDSNHRSGTLSLVEGDVSGDATASDARESPSPRGLD